MTRDSVSNPAFFEAAVRAETAAHAVENAHEDEDEVTYEEVAFVEELLEEIMIHFRHPSPRAACLPHLDHCACVARSVRLAQLGHVNGSSVVAL